MGDSVGGSSGEAIDGKYSHLIFTPSKEEGPLPSVELNRAYERPGKPCYMGFLKIDTEPFISPSEVIKGIRIYQEKQRMSRQKEEINEAISCLRYLFD